MLLHWFVVLTTLGHIRLSQLLIILLLCIINSAIIASVTPLSLFSAFLQCTSIKCVERHLHALMCWVSVVSVVTMKDDQRFILAHGGDTLHFSLQHCNKTENLCTCVCVTILTHSLTLSLSLSLSLSSLGSARPTPPVVSVWTVLSTASTRTTTTEWVT